MIITDRQASRGVCPPWWYANVERAEDIGGGSWIYAPIGWHWIRRKWRRWNEERVNTRIDRIINQ